MLPSAFWPRAQRSIKVTISLQICSEVKVTPGFQKVSCMASIFFPTQLGREQQKTKYVKKYRTGMEHSISSQLWDQRAKFYSYQRNQWEAESGDAPATNCVTTLEKSKGRNRAANHAGIYFKMWHFLCLQRFPLNLEQCHFLQITLFMTWEQPTAFKLIGLCKM